MVFSACRVLQSLARCVPFLSKDLSQSGPAQDKLASRHGVVTLWKCYKPAHEHVDCYWENVVLKIFKSLWFQIKSNEEHGFNPFTSYKIKCYFFSYVSIEWNTCGTVFPIIYTLSLPLLLILGEHCIMQEPASGHYSLIQGELFVYICIHILKKMCLFFPCPPPFPCTKAIAFFK